MARGACARWRRGCLPVVLVSSLIACSDLDEQADAVGGLPFGADATEPDLLVAIIGDQGVNGGAEAVLQLIEDEGAAMALHVGDFDYDDSPDAWDAQIDAVLGSEFPYFSIIGNHDLAAWEQSPSGGPGYRDHIEERIAKIESLDCTGEQGVQAACRYKGLFFVQSGVGCRDAQSGIDHVSYIEDELAADHSIWSLCAWHKNQNDMQLDEVPDEVGWPAYATCMNAGAIIATGHAHSYSRTYTLRDVGNAAAGHGATGDPAAVEVGPGSTFVIVSGLAGIGIDAYVDSHDSDTWWASAYALGHYRKNGKVEPASFPAYGVLFIRFGVDGDPRRAHGYFKNIRQPGEIIDEFDIVAP